MVVECAEDCDSGEDNYPRGIERIRIIWWSRDRRVRSEVFDIQGRGSVFGLQ